MENVKVNAFNKKLKYFKNKKHELKAIFKQEEGLLIFNI